MENIPADWFSLLALTLVLGLKHGFDADHLATIDGLTRFNAGLGRPMARWCGSLFSLGHGAVVLVIALVAGTVAEGWQVPEWFSLLGSLISIGFLSALGLINLQAVLHTPPGQPVRTLGLKGRWLGRLQQTSHPLAVAMVGALFALSFDTLSQATFFALAAGRLGGLSLALTLALTFTLGMLVADGLNGLWIARLIARADQRAVTASRVLGLAVALISLLVAAFGLAKLLSPVVDDWSEGKELALGLCLMVMVAGSYWLACRSPRQPVAA